MLMILKPSPDEWAIGQLGCRVTSLSHVAHPTQLYRDGAEVIVRLYDSQEGSTHFPSALLWFLDCSANVVSCSIALTQGEPKLTSHSAELDLHSVPPWKYHAVLPCAGRMGICITWQAKIVV